MSVSAKNPVLSFDELRDHLFDQFLSPAYVEESGVDATTLEADVWKFVDENQTMSRVLQKAYVFQMVVTRARISVDPYDWYVDKLDHGGILRKLAARWLDEAVSGPLRIEAGLLENAYSSGLLKGPKAGLDLGHIAPGWEHMLDVGLTGLLEELEQVRSSGNGWNQEQLDFFAAVEIVYRSIIDLANRFADLSEESISDNEHVAERLMHFAETCRRIPSGRPRSLHEALQFTWLMHELIEMEGEFVRSMGQFDRLFYPYYRADIESGRIDENEAKELIKFYWMKWYARTRGERNGKNFVFGGQNRDGSLITNELTFLALDAYEELGTPDPKLSIRLNPDEDERLYRHVADLIRKGHTSFVLLNDPVAIRALVNMGKTPEDARFYLPIGCYEPAVEGREAACTMNVTVNLAKILELTLQNGEDHSYFASFDDLWRGFLATMDSTLEMAHRCINAAEVQWPRINPSPCIAGTMSDCIASGKDVGQGGPLYNSVGFVGAGLANATDSLMAIRTAVFEDQEYTWPEILDALHSNFEGYERMREYLIAKPPKWGNDCADVDEIARNITEHYCKKVHSFTNGRGGRCQAALFTLDFAWYGGQRTGALPDGKYAGAPLAPGTGASYGRDRRGVTALLNSVLNIDAEHLPNGSVLDVTLHPSAVAGDSGLEAFVHLIRSYFERGGYALQFNIYDGKTLRDAQLHPDKYSTLQVRLTGWSVYFTSLTPFEQEQFIQRISHTS